MTTDAAREQLRQFILNNYLFTDEQSALADDASFLDNGILDSMGILELIDFLDESFNVKVSGDELVPENLDSINSVLKFLAAKAQG
ncbi:MAG: acyl carrier protein [Moraxellaceae bacterium]|jgi:acyl carrier protein|nr:MAG: acyl carrier protein [Moraxellaceae bacterium]